MMDPTIKKSSSYYYFTKTNNLFLKKRERKMKNLMKEGKRGNRITDLFLSSFPRLFAILLPPLPTTRSTPIFATDPHRASFDPSHSSDLFLLHLFAVRLRVFAIFAPNLGSTIDEFCHLILPMFWFKLEFVMELVGSTTMWGECESC